MQVPSWAGEIRGRGTWVTGSAFDMGIQMTQVPSQAEESGMGIIMDRGSGRQSPLGLRTQCWGGMQGMGTIVFLQELRCVLQHLVVFAQLQLALAVVEHQWRDQALQLQPAILPRLLLPQEVPVDGSGLWLSLSQALRACWGVFC